MRKGFALPFIISLIIILSIASYVLYKTVIKPPQPINDIVLPPPADEQNKESTNSSYKHSPITQACINKLNTDFKDKKPDQQFVSGDVIVSFKKGVTDKESIEIIQAYGLKITLKPANPEQWGVVKVPKGKEVEWICRFSENKDIEYAGLNGIARIAE